MQADPEREYAVAGVLCDLGTDDEGGLPLLLSLLKGHHSAVAPQTTSVRAVHHHHQYGAAATAAGGLSSSWDASSNIALAASTSSPASQAQPASRAPGSSGSCMVPVVRALGRPQLLALLSAACHLRKVRIAALECGALGVLVSEVHEAMRSILTSPTPNTLPPALARAASRPASMQLQPAASTSLLAGVGPVAQGIGLAAGSLAARMSDLQALLSLLETLAAEAAARTAGNAGSAAGAGTGQGRMEGVDSAVQVGQLSSPTCQLSYTQCFL